MSVAVILSLIAVFGGALAALSTPAVAGNLIRLGALSDAVAVAVSRHRVAPAVPYVLAGIGAMISLASGGLAAGWIGWQGWLIGGGLGVVGAIAPLNAFQAGWRKSFVKGVTSDILPMTRMVLLLAGIGTMPLDEALRTFAYLRAGKSALADLLAGCPATESPVAFLESVGIPGEAFAAMVVSFKQVASLSADRREEALRCRVDMLWTRLKNDRIELVKKRAQKVLVVSVVVLLLTLMLAVLAPPVVQLMVQMKV